MPALCSHLPSTFRSRSKTAELVSAFIAGACILVTPFAFAQSCTTSITGKVYSPNGIDPLPNILVYVPTTAVQPLPSGLSTCAAASQLVSGTPLVSTTTAADGTFTLTNPNLAGTQTLVIQAGKWRRQYSGVNITACQTNVAPTLAMPQNQTQGDLPRIAISTGSSDAIECVLRKIGISDSEFTAPGGTGHISLYAGSESPGITTDASGIVLPSESTLVSSQTALNANDLTIFGCQGTATNPAASVIANQNNVVDYANVGGRVFATHYSYVWLNNSTAFAGTANWIPDETISSSTTIPIDATIDQTYAEGVVLANWLYDIGATPTKGQLPLYVTKKDQSSINPPAQSWATLNDTAYNNPVMQFTFDTPLGATNTTGVNVTFANNPTIFQPGDSADTVVITIANASTAPADSSLNLSITLPNGVSPVSLADASGTGGWLCSVATLTCNRATPLAVGTSDAVSLVLAIANTAPLGKNNVAVTVAGGGLSSTNQCGRVLFNEYHVETVSTNQRQFPLECENTAMTPQEKFLEFSLYNLSNFVAPVTSGTIDIQATSTITWSPPAPIYYGTPLGPTQLDATATAVGTTTPAPGTFTYLPVAGSILPVGGNTLSVTFTPTDPSAYTGSTGSTSINVLPDTTATTLTSSSSPSVFGSNVTFTATVTGNAAAPVGTVSLYDGSTLIGQGTLVPSAGDSSVATLNIANLSIGMHTITATYNIPVSVTGGLGNPAAPMPAYFDASTSNTVMENILGTSTTIITGLASPIDYGQIIGDNGLIIVSGSSSGGTLTVYINGVNVCMLPVNQGVQNSCPVTTGAGYAPGTYSIYAVFSGDSLYAGSTSPTYTVQVVPDPTLTTVSSGLNPSYFTNSVTFTGTVTAPFATPAGSVTFYDGSTLLGVGTLASATANSATATYSTSALSVGSHNITVGYAATTDFNASASAPALVQVVQPPLPFDGAPGYTLTVTPINLNAPIGAATPITITVQEFNGYNMPIALTCSPLPTESTCGFTQSTVPAGGGTVTLYLTPAAPHNCGVNPPYFVASGRSKGIVWFSALTLCLLCTRRKRLLRGLTLALALCFLPVLNGCGTGCTDFGTKPGTYSFTLTATPTANPGAAGSPTGPIAQTITFNATL